MQNKYFNCIDGCSDCCIEREYYPSKKFGKIGVLLLPSEKHVIEDQARSLGIEIKIMPRIGAGNSRDEINVIAYQLMGKEADGTVCPFLDVAGLEKSPHGGFSCRVYEGRPLACRAYPVIRKREDIADLDEHCRFCRESSSACADSSGLQPEIEALSKISFRVKIDENVRVWRYATATGDSDEKMLPEGWVAES